MQQKFTVPTLGDAIMDVFLAIKHVTDECYVDKSAQEIRIQEGSKNLIDESAFCLGGNACNVAVALKRLGYSTNLIAELGGDVFGEKMQKELQKEGVSLDFTTVTKNAPSTFSIGLQFEQERTLFVQHVEREHAMQFSSLETEWIYLTSVGREWRDLYHRVVTYKNNHTVRLAFNPGTQQFTDGVDSFRDILALTDILFVNREEAEKILYGEKVIPEKRESPESILFRVLRTGPKVVVMTDGMIGAFVMDENGKMYKKGTAPLRCHIGKTGAGDAYAAAFLGGYIAGCSLEESMQWANIDASSVIEHIGAQTGLLTRKELQERIKKS